MSIAAWTLLNSDPAEAVRLAERSVALNPQDSVLRGYLGALYAMLGESEAAAATYMTGIALAPDRAPNFSNLAAAELRRGNRDAASAALQKHYEIRPVNQNSAPIIGFATRAYAHSLLGQAEEVEQNIAELKQRSANRSVPAGVWSLAHLALREYDTALEYLETAIADREYMNGPLLIIRFNSVDDPVLDSDPRWIDARNRLWPRDE
jgi:tetratricopeptide (TPR) repeat protein